jgi:hypothetical protein
MACCDKEPLSCASGWWYPCDTSYRYAFFVATIGKLHGNEPAKAVPDGSHA